MKSQDLQEKLQSLTKAEKELQKDKDQGKAGEKDRQDSGRKAIERNHRKVVPPAKTFAGTLLKKLVYFPPGRVFFWVISTCGDLCC